MEEKKIDYKTESVLLDLLDVYTRKRFMKQAEKIGMTNKELVITLMELCASGTIQIKKIKDTDYRYDLEVKVKGKL